MITWLILQKGLIFDGLSTALGIFLQNLNSQLGNGFFFLFSDSLNLKIKTLIIN
jgi:hypothetical protein